MLELIVLGQVPGTSIQITFFQLAVITLALVLAYEAIKLIFANSGYIKRRNIDKIAL